MSVFSDVAQLRKDQDVSLQEIKVLRNVVGVLASDVHGLFALAESCLKELQAIHKCVCPDEVVGIEVREGQPTERK